MKKRLFVLLLTGLMALQGAAPAAAEEAGAYEEGAYEEGSLLMEEDVLRTDDETGCEDDRGNGDEILDETIEDTFGLSEAVLNETDDSALIEESAETAEETLMEEVQAEEPEDKDQSEEEETTADAEEEPDLVSAPERLPAPVITGVYNSKNGGDIRWSAVSGATGYHVYRFRSAEKTKFAAETDAFTTQAYDPAILNNCWGRVYHYYVCAVKDGVEGHWSKPAVLQRVAPMDIIYLKSSPTGDFIDVTWGVVAGAENKANGYQVQYAQSTSDLYNRTGTFKTKNLSGRKNISTKITGIKWGATYYFRVRAYVEYTNSVSGEYTKTWSQYSGTKSVKVNETPAELYFDVGRKYLGSDPCVVYLHDLDNDGVKEFMVSNLNLSTSYVDGTEYYTDGLGYWRTYNGEEDVFTIKNGKVIYMNSLKTINVSYNKKDPGKLHSGNADLHYIYGMVNGNLVLLKPIAYNADETSEAYQEYIDFVNNGSKDYVNISEKAFVSTSAELKNFLYDNLLDLPG